MSSHHELQRELERHFSLLLTQRPSGQAIFALEHGLDEDARSQIADSVRATARSRRERDATWLPWIVHATEVAYRYSGEEYWTSFADSTPGWDHRERNWLRATFRRFAREFRGPTPSGRWAEWFNIIAWPITNSILPTDLQRHLARALFELRGELARHLETPRDLGAFIALHAWHGSDRFENLKQQPDLLGQISLGLLRPDRPDGEFLLGSTTRRIVADLQAHRESRLWLGHARTAVERAINTRGPRSAGVPIQRPPDLVASTLRASAPRLYLVQAADHSWTPKLRLPYLGAFGEIAEVGGALRVSRPWIPAASSSFAPGRLLYDRQDVPLSRWPEPDEPLIRFGEPASGLEAAVMKSWVMPGEPWLFKRDRFGKAQPMERPSVRPGSPYILASRVPLFSQLLNPVQTTVPGMNLYQLELQADSAHEVLDELKRLGLGVALGIDVYPVGVPAAWDGQGRSEWLETDEPAFAIVADHPVAHLEVWLRDRSRVIPNISAWSPLVLSVPGLGLGSHELRLVEQHHAARSELAMAIEIRAPRPSLPEHHGPLSGWVDPFSSRLDDLWAGRSTISVVGVAHQAECRLTLASRSGAQALASAGTMTDLPLTPHKWRALLRDNLKPSKGMEVAFDDARWAQVVLTAGPFGKCSFEFERELSPIRWRLQRTRTTVTLRLVDETDQDARLSVERARFSSPTTRDRLSTSGASDSGSGWELASPDPGLYVAIAGRHRAAVIVKETAVMRSFDDLVLRLTPISVDPTPTGLSALASEAELWGTAALTGNPVAAMWRSQVVRHLHRKLVSELCGPSWAAGEAVVYENHAIGLSRLKNQLITTAGVPAAVIQLVDNATQLSETAVAERVQRLAGIAGLAARIAPKAFGELGRDRGSSEIRLAEFTLRLATDVSAPRWAGIHLIPALEVLLAWPVLLQAGRYLGLANPSSLVGDLEYPPLYSGWEWP